MNAVSLRFTVAAILAVIGLTGFILGFDYEFGSARRMGPGYFPIVLSGILAVLALIEGITAVLKPHAEISAPVEWRPLIAILVAVAAFAITIALLGLIPAFFVVIGLASLSEEGYGWRPALILSVITCIGAWLLFSKLLGMALPLVRWGF